MGGLNRLTNPAAAALRFGSESDPPYHPHQAPTTHQHHGKTRVPPSQRLTFFPAAAAAEDRPLNPLWLNRFLETPLTEAWARICQSTEELFHLSYSPPGLPLPSASKQQQPAGRPCCSCCPAARGCTAATILGRVVGGARAPLALAGLQPYKRSRYVCF